MKHGQHIPKDKRDEIARIAHGFATNTLLSLSRAEAIDLVASIFQVSPTTARNLLSRGRFLCAPEPQRKAS